MYNFLIRGKHFIFIIITLVCFDLKANIEIDKDFLSENVENKFLWSKSDSNMSFQEAIHLNYDSLNSIDLSKSNSVFWAKIKLENLTGSQVKLCLNGTRFNEIQLFKNNQLVSISGLSTAINKREFNYSSISTLPFELKANEVSTVYLKLIIKNAQPFEYQPIPLTITKTEKIINAGKNSRYFLLFFLGAITLMTLYNIAIYIQIKKSHYLYFILHNITILVFVLTQSGWIETQFLNHYEYHETLILCFGNFSMITYLLFASSVLDFKKHNPVFHKFLMNFIWIWPLFLIPIFFGYQIISIAIGSILSLVVYNLVLFQTIKAIKRGSIGAKYYLVGNIFHYTGITVSVLMINHVLPQELFSMSAMEVVEVGNMLELTLFSLTLGAVIQEMQKKLTQTEIQRSSALESASFKDQFLANMSHEIRTPLNGIIGMLDVFNVSHDLDKKQKEQLNIVQSSANSLVSIINDILDLSKLQAGKMEIVNSSVNARSFLKTSQMLYSPIASGKNISLSIDISSKVDEYIVLDKARVKQVLNNLISNAIKFTPKNGKVSIQLQRTNNTLSFKVTDSGIGISENEQKKIFENFSQVSEANQNRTDGTGLGLAISFQLSKLMKGKLSVASSPGSGSVFTLEFPYVIGEKPMTEEKEKITPKILLGKKVLIVEDKPVNQKVIQLMVNKIGHETEVANNGLQAIAMFSPGKYDVILMDVQMPEMDGVEATQHLLQKFPNETPPIIGLSANSMEGDSEKYIGFGFTDYLAKPVTLKQLDEKLSQYLQ